MAGPSNHPAAAYPNWLPRTKVPTLVVVGPPGNGARTWIESHAQAGDQIIDLSEIIAELSGVPAPKATPDWIIPALQRRNEMLAELGRGKTLFNAAWLVAPAPMEWQRKFWIEQLGAEIAVLDPGIERALEGAAAEGVEARWVHRWYAEARDGGVPAVQWPRQTVESARVRDERSGSADGRPSSSKRGYGMEHRVLRDKQLARQPWCEKCEAEGRGRVRATVLDHRQPFRLEDGSFDGKLWGDPKNHRSLCEGCHNASGAKWNRKEKPPGAGADGRPLDPNHPWSKKP